MIIRCFHWRLLQFCFVDEVDSMDCQPLIKFVSNMGKRWEGVGLGCWVGRTIWAYSHGSSHRSCAFPDATCLTNRTIGKCSATWLPDCEFLFHSELAFSSIYILQIKVSACAQFCAATTSLQFCICYNNLFGWEVRLVLFREGEASMRRCRKPIME